MKTKPKILITVKGGVVTDIKANQDLDIVTIDLDYNDVSESPVSKVHGPDTITEEPFFEQFNDETDVQEVEVREELKRMKF